MTKKSAFPAVLLVIACGLSACPLYDDDSGCHVDADCATGYLCDDDSGDCYADESDACRRPGDCGANETCSRFGTCTPGDCLYESVGCVRGYTCSSDSGRWECVEQEPAGVGGASGGPNAAGGQAGEPTGAGAGG